MQLLANCILQLIPTLCVGIGVVVWAIMLDCKMGLCVGLGCDYKIEVPSESKVKLLVSQSAILNIEGICYPHFREHYATALGHDRLKFLRCFTLGIIQNWLSAVTHS